MSGDNNQEKTPPSTPRGTTTNIPQQVNPITASDERGIESPESTSEQRVPVMRPPNTRNTSPRRSRGSGGSGGSNAHSFGYSIKKIIMTLIIYIQLQLFELSTVPTSKWYGSPVEFTSIFLATPPPKDNSSRVTLKDLNFLHTHGDMSLVGEHQTFVYNVRVRRSSRNKNSGRSDQKQEEGKFVCIILLVCIIILLLLFNVNFILHITLTLLLRQEGRTHALLNFRSVEQTALQKILVRCN